MAASVYLQKVDTIMDAWMTYSKANSRCTLAVRCNVCATVNCRNALSMACTQRTSWFVSTETKNGKRAWRSVLW